MRLTNTDIEKLKEKLNVDTLYSWSRVHTFEVSPYEYYLKYILKAKEDKGNSVYSVIGGYAHDIIEKFYTKQIEYSDMLKNFDDAWLMVDMADLKFDRTDADKNKKIQNKYRKCLQLFFANHCIIHNKVDVERFITIKVGDDVFQGYIDACYKDDDGNYTIIDWKTSTIYKGDKALAESGQLMLYALGLHQRGIPLEKIKCGWNFLKYVSVTIERANGSKSIREIERSKLGSELQSSAKLWLNKLGYSENIMEYLDRLAQTNDIKCLPKEVQEKFEINDCYVFLEVTKESIDKLVERLTNVLATIKQYEAEYNKTSNEKIWWDSDENVKEQSYYFANLCGYSGKLHKPYGKYLEKLEREKSRDILSPVKNDDNDDMAWLKEL